MLLTKVKQTMRKYSLLSPGDRVLVAVSGGPDSVCLLGVLHALANDLDLQLHVAHLDHMFRGEESAAEARFVAGLAEKLGVPATIEKIDVPAFCRERGLSSQEGAREVRYGFLRRVADDAGFTRIATGHTADDQAETFLMRLLRGAGVSGLAAIPPKRDSIIRPLIDVTKEEVLEYLKSAGLAFVTDPSNTKPVYTRNRIRLEALPVLKRFNPRIVETLAAEAALLREEDESVEAHLATIADGMIALKESVLFVKRDEFNVLPPAFRRRLLRRLVDMSGSDASSLSLDRINEALSFMAAARTGRTMVLPRGLTILREYNQFVISAQAPAGGFLYTLIVPGATAIPELGVEVETFLSDNGAAALEDKNYLWQAAFDYDKIRPPLTVRNRRSGDRFHPAGMGGGSKKLQDYFVDEKVPRRKRDIVPLLTTEQDIVWVIGMRTDGRFLPGTGTKRVLTVQVRSAE